SQMRRGPRTIVRKTDLLIATIASIDGSRDRILILAERDARDQLDAAVAAATQDDMLRRLRGCRLKGRGGGGEAGRQRQRRYRSAPCMAFDGAGRAGLLLAASRRRARKTRNAVARKPTWQQEAIHCQHDCIRGPGHATHETPPLPRLSVSRIV